MEPSPATSLVSRAYQLEMFEQSMKRNVIVAMATGSGKTQVARLRIQAELERSPGKRVWFTAPTVVVAEQQHEFLRSQLPEYQMRTLLGYDKVDLWRDQKIWDAALENLSVVVCTPQVLLDALRNAFVRLQDISLVVVDEAHHCQASSASARIMQEFYHPSKQQNPSQSPYILGLTASSRFSEKSASTEELETNMDAVCCTPTISADDYDLHVHVPSIVGVPYSMDGQPISDILSGLQDVVTGTLWSDDPLYKTLTRATDLRSAQKLKKMEKEESSPATKELKKFLGNAEHIHENLGSWPSDVYIRSCVLNWHAGLLEKNIYHEDLSQTSLHFIGQRLMTIQSQIDALRPYDVSRVSRKAEHLIKFLQSRYHEGIAVIIFVERRSTAYTLSKLLENAPELKNYRAFPFVGLATSRSGTLADIADMKIQKKAFADFRSGSQDICVATSVAEEGLDIQAVNLVIRYDDPKQFVSYIQSRGRARRPGSTFVYFRNIHDDKSKYVQFAKFEKELAEQYKKDQELLEARKIANEFDANESKVYVVNSTGARLSYDNSVAHLDHFCTLSSGGEGPIYVMEGEVGQPINMKVVLPSCVSPELRTFHAKYQWLGEKQARKDAAFQAYRTLHQKGLVSDNLVPFRPEIAVTQQQKRVSRTVTLAPEFDVWRELIDGTQYFSYRLEVTHQGHPYADYTIVLPYHLENQLTFTLYGESARALNVVVQPLGPVLNLDVPKAKDTTLTLFKAAFHVNSAVLSLESATRPALLILVPDRDSRQNHTDTTTLTEFFNIDGMESALRPYFVWKPGRAMPYLWHPSPTTVSKHEDHIRLTVTKVSRLRMYTENRFAELNSLHTSNHVLDIVQCEAHGFATIDGPVALLIPSVLHHFGLALRGEHAHKSLLKTVIPSSSKLLVQALTARSASGMANYERLEFLGDGYLKFHASLQMYVDNPLATEGVLTQKVHDIVSNESLEQATVKLGLARFISTKAPSAKHWKMPGLAESDEVNVERKLESKVLADVIESVLAAVLLDASNAEERDKQTTSLLEVLLPQVDWADPSKLIEKSLEGHDITEVDNRLTLVLKKLLGYQPRRRALFREALTHSTYDAKLQSLDRLEFLGDAIIDWLVKDRLYRYDNLGPDRMSYIRHALVSHENLAYLALGTSSTRFMNKIEMTRNTRPTSHEVEERVFLTDLIAVSDSEQRKAITAAQVQFQAAVQDITSLHDKQQFPWTALRRINAPKVCSDVVESIIAAVYLDSGGDLTVCDNILQHLGLFDHLHSIATNTSYEVRTPHTQVEEMCQTKGLSYKLERAGAQRVPCFTIVIDDAQGVTALKVTGHEGSCVDEGRSIAFEMAVAALLELPERNRAEVTATTPPTMDSTMTDLEDADAMHAGTLGTI